MQALSGIRRLWQLVSYLAVLFVIALCLAATACGAGESFTLNNYTAKNQELEWGYRSHWKQPWRSYLDTVPATTLLNAVGINFNVPADQAAATAKLLGESGFTRARIEIGWNSVEYANPGKLTAAKQQRLRTMLTALRENGIRPLILLNANAGEPTPVKTETVTLMAAAGAGATQIQISPGDVGKVIAGRTGISEDDVAAQVLFKAVGADGTVELSRPLGKSLKAGSLQVTTLRFEPFRAESLANGSPNPAFEGTMRGWLAYVAAVTQEAKAILGDDQFDVEVWNELGFGSQFLSVEDYYSPGIEGGRWENERAILTRTIEYVRDPAHGLADVGVGDGFSDERPWDAGSTSPVGLTAIDKHPYHGLVRFPEGEANGNRPLNGEGRPATATLGGDGVWHESWSPTYDAFFPEYFLSGIQTETLVHDLSPTPSMIGDVEHGRFTHPPGGAAPQVWITEVGLDPTSGPATALSQADVEHIKAKNTLRYLASYVNKGVTNIDFYTADDGNYSLIGQGFFNALRSAPGQYPGAAAGGATMAAVRRMTAAMKGAGPIGDPRSLSLQSLTEYGDNVQFDGNGTAAYPALYNREVLAFLPFQVTDDRFVVPVYVMTRNVEQTYSSGAEPSRFDLPPERYKMTIGGVHGPSAVASATDPLTGETVPVEIVGRTADTVTVEMEVTDSPRMLSLEDGGAPVEAPGEEGGEAGEPQPEPPVEEPEPPQSPDPGTPVVPSSGAQVSAQVPAAPAPVPVGQTATTPTAGASNAGARPGSPAAEADPPKVRLRGGRSVLKNGRIKVVAKCRTKCRLRASGSVRVGGHRYRLASFPHGPVASAGGPLRILLKLDRGARDATRAAAAKGSPVEARATVSTADGARRTVAARIS